MPFAIAAGVAALAIVVGGLWVAFGPQPEEQEIDE